MSKPDRPGELREVRVEAISLVNEAANGERFKIFKSAECEGAPESVKKDERGLFRILKEFFTGNAEPVENGEVSDLADVAVAEKAVEKSGRKISGDRLGKLRDMQALLNEVLSGLDDAEAASKEVEDLTNEGVQKAVDEAVKAVNIEAAVEKALAPIIERIEKLEKARGVSNRVLEDGAIEKRANDFWGGIF